MRRLGRAPARTALLALVPAAGALVLAGGVTAPALAAGPAPVCAAGTCTVSFTAPGTGGSWTVPAGVSALSVTLYAGAGGSSSNSGLTAAGGDGAQLTATLAVSQGETLGVDVGGAGAGGDGQSGVVTAGGVNGGGNGFDSGGGGGATDVTAAGVSLLVAGGGGGAGVAQPAFAGICDGSPNNATFAPAAGGTGGNADTAGTAGQTVFGSGFVANETMEGGFGGAPGTTAGPGAGGKFGFPDTPGGFGVCPGDGISAGSSGGNGSGTVGGDAFGNPNFSPGSGLGDAGGGGGGGGYFGGGAGGSGASEVSNTSTTAGSAGGGGGASYTAGAGVTGALVNDAGNSGQVNGGNGEAVFSYADPIATGSPSYNATQGQSLSVPAASGLLSATAGTTQESGLTASAGTTSAQGGTVAVNADGSFGYTPASGFAGTDTFGYTVTDASGDTATGTAVVMVAASSSSKEADLAVSLSCTASLHAGTTGTCNLTVANHGPSAAAKLTLAVVLPSVVTEVSCTACTVHGTVLTWTQPSLASGGSISDLVMFKAGSRSGIGLALGAAAASNPDPHLLNNIALAIITVKH